MSRPASVSIAGGLALVVAAAGFLEYRTAASASESLAGTPVNAAMAQTISLAALSCPVLSGPRLAGALMANSGMSPDPVSSTGTSGTGVSGMSADIFDKWRPWPKADAKDETAGVYALAHYVCNLSGDVRQSGVDGDNWSLTMAAYYSGVDAVSKAKGVPAAAKDYVDNVNGYTAWYAEQDVFGGSEPSPSASAGATVPEAYQKDVDAAGKVCATVTPARIAAELQAASGFDPNHRSDDGAMGIAGFNSDMWNTYGPTGASPWNPDDAVPALGTALCALVKQVTPMGGDSYANALAAFRVGPTAVRQAGGVPAIEALKSFVSNAIGSVVAVPTPSATSPSPSKTPSSAPPSSAPSSPAPTTPSKAASSKPTTPTTKAAVQYQLLNGMSGKALSVLDANAGSIPLQEPYTATAGQKWLLVADANGSVRIKNAVSGLVLAPQNYSHDNLTFITQVPDASAPETRWTLVAGTDGKQKIKNVGSGMLLAMQYQSNDDGVQVFQYADDNGSLDHLWTIAPVS